MVKVALSDKLICDKVAVFCHLCLPMLAVMRVVPSSDRPSTPVLIAVLS